MQESIIGGNPNANIMLTISQRKRPKQIPDNSNDKDKCQPQASDPDAPRPEGGKTQQHLISESRQLLHHPPCTSLP